MGSPDEGVVERPELYLLAGEDGMKKMMNMEKLFDEVIISRLNGNHSYSYKQQKEEVTIVKESLRRELALSEPKLGLIREEVEGFEKRYEMSSDEDEFVDKFERGELADDQDYFDGAWQSFTEKVSYRLEKQQKWQA